jgi:purine catabolism regulator
MTSHSPITLRAVLKLPVLQRGAPEVLSGADSLDRTVRWVHAGEVPNIASLLKGGELLLTTGMGIAAGDRARRRFVDELAERDIAGLAIELGSTLDRVPPAMVEQADRRSLPVIALHRELPFVEVTEAVHQAIVNRQFLLMRRGDEVHRRFTGLMLDGAGIPEVLSALAETIANPVVLEKAGGGIAYHAIHHADDATVVGAWEGRHRGLSELDAIDLPVPMGGGESWGTLTALALDSPLGDLDGIAVERAVGLIALSLRQHREEAVLAARERGDFLGRVIDREIDDAEARVRAQTLGFPKRVGLMLPIAMVPSTSQAPMATDEAAWALVWRDVRQILGQRGRPVVVGTHAADGVTLAVVALSDGGERDDEADIVAEGIKRAATRRLGDSVAPVIAVGRFAGTWDEVPESLREAEEAVLAAAHGPERPWHDAMRPDVDRLLWSLRDEAALKSFSRTRLEPLVEHDRTHKSKLLPTLRTYCALAGRKGDVARALHIERQTLYYRLARIEALLELDLSDGDAVLGIHIALRSQERLAGDGA